MEGILDEIKFKEIYDRNVDAVYKVSFSYMKNKHDAEDVVQDTFVQLIRKNPQFENEKHERAWLIVIASNLCKNSLKSWKRKNEDIEDPGRRKISIHQVITGYKR